MTQAPPTSPSDTTQAVREPLFIALPPMKVRFSVVRLLFAGFIFVAIASLMAFTMRAPPFVLLIFGITFLFMMTMMGVLMPLRQRREVKRFLVSPPPMSNRDASALADGFEQLMTRIAAERPLLPLRVQDAFVSWPRIESLRAERGLPRCIAVVSAQIREAIEPIPRDAAMLEPEFILSSKPQTTRASIVLSCLFAFQASLQFAQSRWLIGGMNTGLMLMMLISIPQVRNKVPGLRFEERAPIAGMGVIEDRKKRRWTVNDSMMFVWSKGGGRPLYVYVAGPAGWLPLTFATSSDPDFVNLWQRWMHPHPRPDLLA